MDVSEYTKRTIYSKSSPWINAVYDNWMNKIYLERVELNLMKTVEHVIEYMIFYGTRVMY